MTEHRIDAIRKRLACLNPTTLNITDDSHKHIGHEGAKSGGGHFTIEIASPLFSGKSKIACHRLIYDALGNLMGREIHAVSIQIV